MPSPVELFFSLVLDLFKKLSTIPARGYSGCVYEALISTLSYAIVIVGLYAIGFATTMVHTGRTFYVTMQNEYHLLFDFIKA